MMTFDAAGREACTVRETRTNTPLQALTLMNDVTFVEAARMLAERMMREGGATPDERIALAFRLVTGARPERRGAGSAARRLRAAARPTSAASPAAADEAAGSRRIAARRTSSMPASWPPTRRWPA